MKQFKNNKLPVNSGCIRDPFDPRDYNALELMGALGDAPSFAEGYSVKKKYWPDMPYKNQGQTFSCVGQAWSYYKQILQTKDTGEKTELSAKSIYNPIAFPGKGSYIREGGLRTVEYGVNKESSVPFNGTEEEVTAKFNFEPFKEEAAFYKNRVTASINTQDFDLLRKVLFTNDGVVSGWGSHAVWFEGYGVLNGKRYFHTPNSYGPENDLYYFEGDLNPLFSSWTAIDIRNMKIPGKLRLIRAVGEKTVWYLLGNTRYWVHDPQMMSQGLAEGIWDGFAAVEELTKEEVYSYPKFSTSLGELWRVYTSK